jgi:hypothetical protein
MQHLTSSLPLGKSEEGNITGFIFSFLLFTFYLIPLTSITEVFMGSKIWYLPVFIFTLLLILGVSAGCGDDDDDDDEYPTCERDTELVFDALVDFTGEGRTFRFWLDENQDDFLSGWARDLEAEREYPVLGETKGKKSYVLTFTPGPVYQDYLCPKTLSLTLDLKNLVGTMSVFCELVKLDEHPAEAEILCDETGITLDNS